MPLTSGLRALVYDDFNKAKLLDDLTDAVSSLDFSTALHGGFDGCNLLVATTLDRAWLYLDRELPGRHYAHLLIAEDKRTVWEGRMLDITLRATQRFVGLKIYATGYWSACRDRYYDADDAGNTDWTASGPHVVSKVIKELLTASCPDINSDQSNIDANNRDIVGIDLKTREYPQDIIVDKLAPLSDDDNSVWYFAVWDDRKAYWKKRVVNQVDAYVWLADTANLELTQDGKYLRNRIIPFTRTAAGAITEGTAKNQEDSQNKYPRRDLLLHMPLSSPTAAQNDARDTAAEELRKPRQTTAFTVNGHIYSSAAAVGPTAKGDMPKSGALVEIPKWRLRAGDVVRIQDLIPESISTPVLDNLRTFYVIATRYDAVRDILEVQPDRPGIQLETMLARANLLERNR